MTTVRGFKLNNCKKCGSPAGVKPQKNALVFFAHSIH